MNLYLVRHGLSTANQAQRLQGQWDTDLAPEGLRQAGATGRFLAHYFAGVREPVEALYTSDLKRARTTAEVIGRYLNLTPLTNPGLREMHAGLAEGLTAEEWQAAHPTVAAGWKNTQDLDWGWPGGETRRQLVARATATLSAIVDLHRDAQNVIVVTHGGVIRSYLNHGVTRSPELEDVEVRAGNCSIHHIQFSATGKAVGVGCLIMLNRTEHLEDPAGVETPDAAGQLI
jgi:broad specificity phosphatase PhoE